MNCDACGHANVDGARFCAACGATITSAPQTDPHIGATAGGRYLITRVVGEGGMGVVYEAEQRMGTTVRKVAVKTLHAELSRDESIKARFHREVGTVAQLEHQNTVRVYDFGTMPDGTLYIAMEFLAGEPLEKVISKHAPLKPERVISLLRQMSGSLSEAHSQGVVHRDLKPENVILIERAGQRDFVKLVDFGIAARTESADAAKEAKLTQQGMVLGTPPYMSPEQFTGQELDHRSDIYSLAVMAYEMLTGRLPFDATTPWQWATQHMTARPVAFETLELNVHVPHGMRQAILRALEKEPNARFASVEEFVAALSAGAGAGAGAGTGTVASTAVQPPTSKRTAAMEAAPDFAVEPAVASAATATMPAHSPAAAPHRVSPPVARRSSGPNKGLLYGVVGGVGLLAAGLVFALAGGKEEIPSPVIEVAAAPTSIGVVDSTDQTDQFADVEAPAGDETGADEESTAQKKVAPKAAARKTTKSSTSTSSSKKPTPKKKPTAAPKKPTATPTKPVEPVKPTVAPPAVPTAVPAPVTNPSVPKVNVDAACRQCEVFARRNILSAAVQYRLCPDASKKARCAQRVLRAAPRAARGANCTTARQIQAAAISMNAGSGALNNAVAACKQ